MSELVLSIDPASSSPGWTGKWIVDGRAVGAPIEVAGAGFEGMTRLSRRFLELFEGGGRPLVEPDALRARGVHRWTVAEPATVLCARDSEGQPKEDETERCGKSTGHTRR